MAAIKRKIARLAQADTTAKSLTPEKECREAQPSVKCTGEKDNKGCEGGEGGEGSEGVEGGQGGAGAGASASATPKCTSTGRGGGGMTAASTAGAGAAGPHTPATTAAGCSSGPTSTVCTASPDPDPAFKSAGRATAATPQQVAPTTPVSSSTTAVPTTRYGRTVRVRDIEKELCDYVPRVGCHNSLPPGRVACHLHECGRMHDALWRSVECDPGPAASD
jgi:hypothetical protein